MSTNEPADLTTESAALVACLAMGSNGATSKAGGSQGITTAADREHFLALRNSSQFGAIVVGARTAAVEPYAKTPHPLFIYRRESGLTAKQFTESIRKEVVGAILCEGGVGLIHQLLVSQSIDSFHLTRTPMSGDGHFLDEKLLLENMSLRTSSSLNGTTFERYERASHLLG